MTNKLNTGFSLIEMLVVITIMLILLGGGIAGYLDYSERQESISTAKQYEELVNTAMTKARAGEIHECAQDLWGYSVKYVQANSKFILSEECSDNTSSIVQEMMVSANVTLSFEKTSTEFPGLSNSDGGIIANVSARGGNIDIVGSPTGSYTKMRVKFARASKTYQLDVYREGRISDVTLVTNP